LLTCPHAARRQYARYFGGDLRIISMEGYVRSRASWNRCGRCASCRVRLAAQHAAHARARRYGTDAYVHLCRLGDGLEPTKLH